MTYSKPEVTMLDTAVDAIQSMGKQIGAGDTPFETPPTAYESDE